MDELELWKARAEVSLPIVEAALNLTKAHAFEMSTRQGLVVNRAHYEKLTAAVNAYLESAKQESKQSE